MPLRCVVLVVHVLRRVQERTLRWARERFGDVEAAVPYHQRFLVAGYRQVRGMPGTRADA